ncbi:hypothetical protein HO913_04060 [Streptococcus suis]|nr:hypothetical protein [Streptococcus suis]HEL1557338.1 hypothetical protein [Streptococcus suis]HEM3177468.1 hypothetical protein [Streptococcus suis]
MKKYLAPLVLCFGALILVACSKAEEVVVETINNIDGRYVANAYGFELDVEIDGETISGEASVGIVDSDITGSVDLQGQEIDIDLTESKSISGTYEKMENGDLEVDFSGKTIVFEKQ